MITRYIDRAFVRVYHLYKKWGDYDVFFSTSFALSMLAVFACNMFCALIFYYTRWEAINFDLWPIGTFLIIILLACLVYFYSRRKYLFKLSRNWDSPMNKIDWIIFSILFLMLSSGVFSAVLYRWGNIALQ